MTSVRQGSGVKPCSYDYQTLLLRFIDAGYNTGVCVCVRVRVSQDSLAAEIEGTMRRELSVEEESAFQEQR